MFYLSCNASKFFRRIYFFLLADNILVNGVYLCFNDFFDHRNRSRTSSTPMSSSSGDLLPIIFYFSKKINTSTLPNNTISPVCPLYSSCVVYGASIHNFITTSD